jgi:L-ribulose-5-phosphate 3-epimerase
VVQLGFNSNSFRSHRLNDVLPWLAELGYRAVAITPDVGCLDPASATLEEVRKVGQLCQQLGLQVVVETGARYVLDPRRKHRPNLLELDDSWRTRQDFLLQMLQWCGELGSSVLSFWSGALPEGQSHNGARARMLQAMTELAPLAEKAGVSLALEPEPGHWIDSVQAWREFRDQSGLPLKMTLDVGHLLVSRELPVEAVIRSNAEHIANVHVDDMRLGVHDHLALGEGEIEWPPVVAALNELPASVPACLELSRDSHRFHQLAASSLLFLQQHGLH